mgnify:CR=1 FL=1
MTTKLERRIKIKYRVRNKISGTTERPRMSVFRSNKQIYVKLSMTCLVELWLQLHLWEWKLCLRKNRLLKLVN